MKHLFLIIFLFVSALSYCQNMLDSYIDIAINNSPLIKTKYNDLLAKKEDIKAKVSLENPELSVSLLPKPMMNVNGEQIASVSIMQMFPWFGTLSNNRKMLECETQSAYWTLVNSLNDIIYNVKILYYDMTLLNCQIKTLENQKQILQQIKETLIIDYASKGQNSIPNLNNIEIKKEELDLEILTLQTTLNTKKQQFNNLLHQNLQDEILLLDTINNDEVQEFYIFDSIINNNPELKAIQESSLSLQHAIQMQKKMSYPMIGVGLEWMINKQIDMPKMESMNGKDMFGIMLKVSLPVYRKKYSSSITSIKYKNLSLEEDFQYKIERLRNEFLSLCNDMTIERKKIDLYHRQQNLLKENISIEQNTYSTKNNNIKDLLELEYKLFDYQIKILVSQTNLNKIVAKMEQLKGEDNTYILRK